MYIDHKLFDPTRSKLAAAMKKGMKINLSKKDTVLYLGASHGYTPWFVSKMVGFVFAVEFSAYVVPTLMDVCRKLDNVAPILSDANLPLSYLGRVSGVDVIYQDISQKNQVEIFLKNINLYLNNGGIGYLVVKCNSIDVSKTPYQVFTIVRRALEKHLNILEYSSLEPYEKGHYMIKVRK